MNATINTKPTGARLVRLVLNVKDEMELHSRTCSQCASWRIWGDGEPCRVGSEIVGQLKERKSE